MSQAIRDFEKSFTSTNDLSAAEYLVVAIDTSHDNSIVAATAGTDPIVGVLQNKPKAGEPAVVRWGGSSKCVASAAITRGARVTATTGGKIVTTTSDKDVVLGLAVESASGDGSIIEVALVPFAKNSF